MEIYITSEQRVVTEGEFRSLFPNTSFPPQLSEELINSFGGEIVFEGPQASGGEFWQYSMRSGVERVNGKLFTKYVLGPVFETQEQQDAYVAQKTQERTQALISSITDATQKRLDDFAKTRNYDGVLSACTYATSPTPRFAAEGQYCVERRDATWAKLYEILSEVQAGTRPMPTGFTDIESELPELVWPS